MAGISFHAREKLKKGMADAGFDILSSKREFYTTKNKIASNLSLKWSENYLNCVNIKEVIQRRVKQLKLAGLSLI